MRIFSRFTIGPRRYVIANDGEEGALFCRSTRPDADPCYEPVLKLAGFDELHAHVAAACVNGSSMLHVGLDMGAPDGDETVRMRRVPFCYECNAEPRRGLFGLGRTCPTCGRKLALVARA